MTHIYDPDAPEPAGTAGELFVTEAAIRMFAELVVDDPLSIVGPPPPGDRPHVLVIAARAYLQAVALGMSRSHEAAPHRHRLLGRLIRTSALAARDPFAESRRDDGAEVWRVPCPGRDLYLITKPADHVGYKAAVVAVTLQRRRATPQE